MNALVFGLAAATACFLVKSCEKLWLLRAWIYGVKSCAFWFFVEINREYHWNNDLNLREATKMFCDYLQEKLCISPCDP